MAKDAYFRVQTEESLTVPASNSAALEASC